MAHAILIPFDRPLVGAAIPGQAGRFCSESELAARDEAAYARGVDAARGLADQEMVEFRADIERLSQGVFRQLGELEPAITAQLRETLPALAVEIARRLLAGYEPSSEVVTRICEEALAQVFPERENLELVVAPRDAELLQRLNPDWLHRYPGLRIRAEASLVPGDCKVHSRFGLTDARLETKLDALRNNLVPA
ncbi:MAG TPA: FliH/SctL family protein [Opitutaceae bacterium]|nr:FliH/SctL family protein [Opitutaceae bacterium]